MRVSWIMISKPYWAEPSVPHPAASKAGALDGTTQVLQVSTTQKCQVVSLTM
jgi:hypothetical protein